MLKYICTFIQYIHIYAIYKYRNSIIMKRMNELKRDLWVYKVVRKEEREGYTL